ncbi:MAG TPA: hypothetical protein VFP06_16760 [Acidimicrobiales bacterium]|nr:hypothetical protein [Acidimicrobiales bacterium]
MTSVQDDGGTTASPPVAAGDPGDAGERDEAHEPGASTVPDAASDAGAPVELAAATDPGPGADPEPGARVELAAATDPGTGAEPEPGAGIELAAATDPVAPAGSGTSDGDDGDDGDDDAAAAARRYTPPPSPAYAEQPTPVIRYTRPDPEVPTGSAADEATGERVGGRSSAADRSVRRGRQLLTAGSLLLGAAGGTAAAVVVTGGGGASYAFGEIAAVRGEPVVVVGESTGDTRPLEVGETVEAGWLVQLPDDAAVTVELDGGGIARFDSGARFTVVDRGAGAPTGRQPDRSIEVTDGRAWINPGGSGSGAVEVRLPAGAAGSDGNPVAIDCTAACTVEAPAGGVTVTTGTGGEAHAATPVADEVVTLDRAGGAGVQFASEPSAWAQQNLAADADAGLPEPQPDDRPGIRATAVLDGDLAVSIEVVGAPSGDAIPQALRYQAGETYALDLAADGSACTSTSCRVPITAADGAAGSAQVADGSVALTLSQPIDCYDETYTSVVVPGIGTTTVAATLEVTGVAHDGDRWLVDAVDGSGTVAATLSTACNAGDTLGTSTSEVAITGR